MTGRLSRRRLLALSAAAGAGIAAGGRAGAGRGQADSDGPTVALEPVADGFTAPLGVEAPTDTDRLYVFDQAGAITALGPDDARETFLDVTDRMVSLGGGYTEQGLLGLAFHPEFPDDDRCFVRYSAPPREGTPDGYAHTFVLAEFRATPTGADPDSERTLLEIPQPQGNHNAGPVAFGPDGYLYVAVGDGGAGGDQGRGHVADWYDAVEGGNGQDVTENPLGSILRIDVDGQGPSARRTGSDDVDESDGDRPYAIPEDNPLVGEPGLDEHYAWGLRNPWGMSFGPEGRLFVADVGQNRFEEIDVVERGGNYGWNVREATHCYGAEDCPEETPDGEPLRDPIVEYDHDRGIAVVGGYLYRGQVDGLLGRYVFGDWSSGFGSPDGSLFAAAPPEDGAGSWSMTELSVEGRENGDLGRYLLGFGRDPGGELYVCTSGEATPTGSTGAIHRIVPAGDGSDGGGSDGGGSNDSGSDGGESPSPVDGTEAADPDGDGQGLPGFGPAAALAGLALGIGGAARRLASRDGD